jgi:mannose-6-phosphate isomerase
MKVLPFKTRPSFQSRPWGGRAMADVIGKKLPDGPVAESWEVSAHPNGMCHVDGGPLDGISLGDLVREAGADLLGKEILRAYNGEFPLLVKLIDVNALASVQVHPDDEQARRLEGYPRGKAEAWYIIERGENARFSLGMVPGVTPESLRTALLQGRAQQLLESPEVRGGDCLFVPPGTVHAAGNGVLLLEVQQSCDITYRVYDWDRVDAEGRRRELHVEKALQVIDFRARPQIFRAPAGVDSLNRLLTCPFFEMFELALDSGIALPPRPSCATGTLVHGTCRLGYDGGQVALACGDSFVVPAGTAAKLDQGKAKVIYTILA